MSDIYLRAAELIDSSKNSLSCVAIRNVVDPCRFVRETPPVLAYQKLFTPKIVETELFWGNRWGDDRKQCRVLALLFMHAIENYKEPR